MADFCEHCHEEIVEGDEIVALNNGDMLMHHACAMRTIIGSVAHQQKKCSCFVADSAEGDPPGLSKRQAAQAAVDLFAKGKSKEIYG